jgi:hypothetical protein
VTPERLLREDEVAVDRHLEDAAARLDELDVTVIETQLRSQLGRQTGGPLFVSSDDAVFDRNLHSDHRTHLRRYAPNVNRTGSLVTAGAAILLVAAAVFLAFRPSPRCHERIEYADGRVITRSWIPETTLGGGGGGPGVVAYESSCTSDAMLWWEAAGAIGLLAAAFGWVALRTTGSRGSRAAAAGRFGLALVTLAAVGTFFYGAFAAPVLIPLHWLAARRSGRAARIAWTAAASICAGLAGWAAVVVIGGGHESAAGPVAGVAAALVCALVFGATDPTRRDTRRAASLP